MVDEVFIFTVHFLYLKVIKFRMLSYENKLLLQIEYCPEPAVCSFL